MRENEVLYAIYANDTFVKVKQALGIGKMLLSFVNKGTKEHIDIYLDAEEFGALFMQDVRNGLLFKKLAEEKAKGEQYPKNVFTSSYGGYEDKNNEECFSRFFTIAPGSKAEIIITANLYKATKTETGAFVPVKNSRPILTIRVPATLNDLKIMNYVWEFLAKDYFTNKYSVANMQSEYSPNREEPSEPSSSAPESPNRAQNDSCKELPNAAPNLPKKGSDVLQNTIPNAMPEPTVYHLTNTSKLMFMKNGYDQCIKAVDDTGKEHTIIFHLTVTEKIASWEKFEEAIARGKTKFNIIAKQVGKSLHFYSFAA